MHSINKNLIKNEKNKIEINNKNNFNILQNLFQLLQNNYKVKNFVCFLFVF